ncbi:hypothetical protein FACS189499_02570 [Clostridia bacterium]|nr:hypothetical protein FACS189499_02570 [Clostridia bacterium]
MHWFRITKYDPLLRDSCGRYTLNHWTSFHDIDKTFEDAKLTYSMYLTVENLHVDAVLECLNLLHIDYLFVKELEKRQKSLNIQSPDSYTDDMNKLYMRLDDGSKVYRSEISTLCRLILQIDFKRIHVG